MPSLKKHQPIITNAIFCLYCVFIIVAVVASYEMISVFVETLFNAAREVDFRAIQRGVAQY